MKRLRLFFAIPVLCLFLPMWRYLDMLNFAWPEPRVFGVMFALLVFLFIALPARLISARVHWGFIIAIPIALGIFASTLGSVSQMATANPDFNHCGTLSYTGFFYPARHLLTDAHQDDLEIRNQLCWVRKMVTRVLPEFKSEIEYTTYHKLTRDKLMKPARKYRVSLPLIGVLYGNIIHRWDRYNIPLLKNIQTGKLFIEEMNFWTREYTEEVSARDYGWWDWLHGTYIKWEYSFIEENWQRLLDGVFVE